MRPIHQAIGAQEGSMGRPAKMKKEHTGCGETAPERRKPRQESGRCDPGFPENERESLPRRTKAKKAADDLEIALEERIRLNGDATQPVGAATTKRKPAACARKIVARSAAMLERCLAIIVFPKWYAFSGPGAYLIRLLSSLGRCRRIGERVTKRYRACGFRDLYQSAGKIR